MKNKYQSWKDWILGRWKCPKCGTVWERWPPTFFDDLALHVIEGGKIVEKRLECPECGFEEIIYRRKRK